MPREEGRSVAKEGKRRAVVRRPGVVVPVIFFGVLGTSIGAVLVWSGLGRAAAWWTRRGERWPVAGLGGGNGVVGMGEVGVWRLDRGRELVCEGGLSDDGEESVLGVDLLGGLKRIVVDDWVRWWSARRT